MAYMKVPLVTGNARTSTTPQGAAALLSHCAPAPGEGPPSTKRVNGLHLAPSRGNNSDKTSKAKDQRPAASKAVATSNSSTKDETQRGVAPRPAMNGYHGAGDRKERRGAEANVQIQTQFIDKRTYPIIFLLFHTTLTQANLDREVIKRLEIDELMKKLESRDRKFVEETCDRFLEYVRNSEDVAIDSQVRGLESAKWNVNDNNVNVEFKKVVNETFDESVNWGSVISFLGFALGFSVFIHNRGMKKTVVSVAEWTKQVIEEDIGTFFLTNNGWEGFREVIDTLLRRQRRLQSQHRAQSGDRSSDSDSPSFWQNALAMTTVAAGAAVLIGLRQAFS